MRLCQGKSVCELDTHRMILLRCYLYLSIYCQTKYYYHSSIKNVGKCELRIHTASDCTHILSVI